MGLVSHGTVNRSCDTGLMRALFNWYPEKRENRIKKDCPSNSKDKVLKSEESLRKTCCHSRKFLIAAREGRAYILWRLRSQQLDKEKHTLSRGQILFVLSILHSFNINELELADLRALFSCQEWGRSLKPFVKPG